MHMHTHLHTKKASTGWARLGTRAVVAAVAAASWGLAVPAWAGNTVFNFQPGDSWRTTTNRLVGQQWALGNFDSTQGEAVYTPFPTGSGFDNVSMWNCGVAGAACLNGNGVVDGVAGPQEAFFGYSFFVKPGATVSAAIISLLADDFFHLNINGVSVAADTLDNRLANNAGAPMQIDIASFLQEGTNVLAIRALDGRMKDGANACPSGALEVRTVLGPFCQEDRVNQWVRVSGSALVVPEPTAMWLAGTALFALALQRKIRRVP